MFNARNSVIYLSPSSSTSPSSKCPIFDINLIYYKFLQSSIHWYIAAEIPCRNMTQPQGKKMQKEEETYNTKDSLVVTDPTTSLALTGLSMGERTGSRVPQWVWSYVLERSGTPLYAAGLFCWSWMEASG